MLDCISVENMRLSDQQTIAELVPGLELMGRAAEGVFRTEVWQGPVAIVAGSGNNGGDGFALAVLLHQAGIPCTVFTIGSRLSDDSAYYADLTNQAGIPILPLDQGDLSRFRTVVDCLLGTGFQGSLRPHYRDAIEKINASGARIVSVDINSGMNGDTGDADLAVRSHLTVTIGFVKNGLLTENAGAHMDKLVCVDIGIRLARQENKICTREEWENRNPEERKTTFPCPAWLDMNVIDVTA